VAPLETAVEQWALLDGLRALGDFAIVFAIAILPWLLVVGLVLYVIVRLIRRRSRAKERPPSTDQSSARPPEGAGQGTAHLAQRQSPRDGASTVRYSHEKADRHGRP
jgi:hypothetical protein